MHFLFYHSDNISDVCEYILEESQTHQSFRILLEVKGLQDTIQPYILVGTLELSIVETNLLKIYFLCPIMPTAPDKYAIFLSPLPLNRLCRTNTSPPGQPWNGHGGLCWFYKVHSLAVATRISNNYQVLLDDGNRIIIPQGNFKF